MVDEFKKKDERRSLALNEMGVTEWQSKKNEVIQIQSTVKLVNADKWGVLRKLGDGIEARAAEAVATRELDRPQQELKTDGAGAVHVG